MRSHTIDGPSHPVRWRRARQAGAGALVLLASSGPAAADALAARCPAADQAPLGESRAQAAAAVVCVLNRERARRNLPRLRAVSSLERAAKRHAGEMVRRRFFAHTTPEGITMTDRLRAVGYVRDDHAWTVGETLAWGTGTRATPAAVVDAWLASPSHRRVLLDDTYQDVGIGVITDVPFEDAADPLRGTYAAELGVRS